MQLQDILSVKGSEVHTIRPQASLDDVVDELVRFNCGSLLVTEATDGDPLANVIGIITERDILRAQATHRVPLGQMQVAEAMSTTLITAAPTDRIEVAMRLMTQHRIRHLPLMTGDQLFGIVSIGDIVKAHHDQLEQDNNFMRSYIQGEGGEVATPDSAH